MSRAMSLPVLFLAACSAVAQPPAAPSEVHVVSISAGQTKTNGVPHGGKAAVHVDRPGKDVTLVLSAYDSVTWEVTAAPKTKIVKVVVGGYHRQSAKVPDGVPVVEMFREGREGKDDLRVPYKFESGELRPAVRALHELTKQEIDSFTGASRADLENPFVVNEVQREPRLASDYPKVSPPAELPKVKFAALQFAPQGRRGDWVGSVGEFTQAGPDKATLKPLPRGMIALTYDPVGKKHSGITNHEVHEVDLATQTSKKLDPGLGVPQMSWPCGIAFDTKRERLVVVTLSGSGVMYEYSPKTGAWVVIADLRNVDLACLTYNPKDDTLYGLAAEGGSDAAVTRLYRYNANGAVVSSTELASPIFPGIVGRMPDGRTQLVAAGDHLALLGGTGRRGDERTVKAESFLFFIDPKTDKVKLAWKE